jgi:dienelactone hydrolase
VPHPRSEWPFPLALALAVGLSAPSRAAEAPTPQVLQALEPQPDGPRITPFLVSQLERAWAQDAARQERFARVKTEADLGALQEELRRKALALIGGLPEAKTPLNVRVTGTIPKDGYRIEKTVFESLPGIHVTALVYVPDAPAGKKPAVLLACGHSEVGKAFVNYQEIATRLVRRGYVVLCWDPVGQGERSQFWDKARGRSRYNLVCGEHAVLGNFATLAGTSLVRYAVWDGMRAADVLLARDDVDGSRLAITGTSGGGFQALWIGALDRRIAAVLPSCFPTALPMRMANRIFEDPDSDPEQDPPGLVSEGIGHAGLLLLVYPRPLHVSAAVLDFFPIEGTRQAMREVASFYARFGHGDRVALSQGYHKHQYSAENQAKAFAFLDRAFGQPVHAALGEAKTLPPEALRCTPSGQVREDLKGRSLMEVIRDEARAPHPPSPSIGERG